VTLMLTDLDRLIDVLPIGVYVCEAPGGAIRLYNRRAVELWGREPVAADRFCGSHRVFDAAGHPLAHAASPVAVVAYRRYFGIPADAQRSSLEPRVFPDDLLRVRDAVAGLTPASPSVIVENRVFRADGQVC